MAKIVPLKMKHNGATPQSAALSSDQFEATHCQLKSPIVTT